VVVVTMNLRRYASVPRDWQVRVWHCVALHDIMTLHEIAMIATVWYELGPVQLRETRDDPQLLIDLLSQAVHRELSRTILVKSFFLELLKLPPTCHNLPL